MEDASWTVLRFGENHTHGVCDREDRSQVDLMEEIDAVQRLVRQKDPGRIVPIPGYRKFFSQKVEQGGMMATDPRIESAECSADVADASQGTRHRFP
jgi:hypothetical protein